MLEKGFLFVIYSLMLALGLRNFLFLTSKNRAVKDFFLILKKKKYIYRQI